MRGVLDTNMMVIETAISGRADMIVSGDKDLTDAAEVTAYLAARGTQVISARTFVRVLQLLPPEPSGQPLPGGDLEP